MKKIVLKIVISLLTVLIINENCVLARFIEKGNLKEDAEIIKICRKGCEMKFNKKTDFWDRQMCIEYCDLISKHKDDFKDRKKKVIKTLICSDFYCVSTYY